MIYFGVEDLKNIFFEYISGKSLCSLISVTIVISLCFIYSTLFKDILELFFNENIKIDEWYNIKSYLIGRSIVIFCIFIFYNKILKDIKKK